MRGIINMKGLPPLKIGLGLTLGQIRTSPPSLTSLLLLLYLITRLLLDPIKVPSMSHIVGVEVEEVGTEEVITLKEASDGI